jgi:hypothetical protein
LATELDHLFVLTEPGAPVADRLVALGLVEGARNEHPGMGTANRRFFFQNKMLELLFVVNEAEARSEPIEPARVWERSRWRETGASPFGLCLRQTGGPGEALPFETWAFKPPFVGPDRDLPAAVGTADWEPFVFVTSTTIPPSAYPADRRQPLEHQAGLGELTELRVTLPGADEFSAPLRTLERLGIASFQHGAEQLAELTFDAGRRGRSTDLRPDLPVVLRW